MHGRRFASCRELVNGEDGWANPVLFRRSITRWRFAHRLFLREIAFIRDAPVFRVARPWTVRAAHFFDRLGFRHGFTVTDRFQLVTKFTACKEAVHFAGAVHLALDANARRQVFEKHAVRRLVNFLSARP